MMLARVQYLSVLAAPADLGVPAGVRQPLALAAVPSLLAHACGASAPHAAGVDAPACVNAHH